MSEPTREVMTLPLPDGETLSGDLSSGGTRDGWAVVWVHGFGSHRGGEKSQALAEACARRGWTFAAFDFRGHGQSGGRMRDLRGSRLLEDLGAVRDLLAARGVWRFGLVGSSMGGWASMWFALAEEAVPACVLLAPAFRFVRRRWETLTEAQREEWRRTGLLRVTNEWVDTEIGYGIVEELDRFPPERLADEWAKPLLIFHGLADEVVPATDSLAFVERTKCPDVELRLFKSGDHRLTAFKDEIAEAACRFFERFAAGT